MSTPRPRIRSEALYRLRLAGQRDEFEAILRSLIPEDDKKHGYKTVAWSAKADDFWLAVHEFEPLPPVEARPKLLERYKEANWDRQLMAALRKKLSNRQEVDGLSDQAVLINLTDDELYRALETLGDPPPQTEQEEEKYEEPPTNNPDWPFLITKKQAAQQVFECRGRSSSYVDDVMWVADNLDNHKACPREAPSNRAWSILLLASSNNAQRAKFLNEVLKQVMLKNEQDSEQTRQVEDDKREIFRLLEQFE